MLAAAALVTALRAVDLKLRAGVDAIAIQGGHDARGLLEQVFSATCGGTILFALAYAFKPQLSQALGAIPALANPDIAWLGFAIALAGTILVGAAQIAMGRSWRIGVPFNERNPLMTGSLYRCSRNPIYVGMVGIVLGIFLLVPDAVMLALLGIACVSVAVQVRIEEDYLRRVHGDAYEAYCARTRRWA